jgi:hypothetical protein
VDAAIALNVVGVVGVVGVVDGEGGDPVLGVARLGKAAVPRPQPATASGSSKAGAEKNGQAMTTTVILAEAIMVAFSGCRFACRSASLPPIPLG